MLLASGLKHRLDELWRDNSVFVDCGVSLVGVSYEAIPAEVPGHRPWVVRQLRERNGH